MYGFIFARSYELGVGTILEIYQSGRTTQILISICNGSLKKKKKVFVTVLDPRIFWNYIDAVTFVFVVDLNSEFLAFSFALFRFTFEGTIPSDSVTFHFWKHSLRVTTPQAPPHKNLPLDLMMTSLSPVTVRSDYDFLFPFVAWLC